MFFVRNDMRPFTILVVGERGIGKTTFIRRMVDGSFSKHYTKTKNGEMLDTTTDLLTVDLRFVESSNWSCKFVKIDFIIVAVESFGDNHANRKMVSKAQRWYPEVNVMLVRLYRDEGGPYVPIQKRGRKVDYMSVQAKGCYRLWEWIRQPSFIEALHTYQMKYSEDRLVTDAHLLCRRCPTCIIATMLGIIRQNNALLF